MPKRKRETKNDVKKTYDFTIYPKDESDYDRTIEKLEAWTADATRLQVSAEVCPETNRDHLQCKITWKIGKRWSAMKKLLGDAHFEPSVSTCFAYCAKIDDDNKLLISHDARAPGARNDLMEMKAMIDEGCTKEELWQEHFGSMTRYSNAMEKYMLLKSKHKPRVQLEVEWIIGSSGVGKSTKAEAENPHAYWLTQDSTDNIWWDGYDGEETIIIDDFRPSMFRYEQLLKLLNSRGKYRLCHKGGSSWLNAKKFVITSVLHPSEMYRMYDEQLDRRITKLTKL